MTTYERIEFSDRARRVFNPAKACASPIKAAITACQRALDISWNRARDLLRGKALPTVKEMDFVRSLDGVWCPTEQKAKPDIMERMHDKIDAIYQAYVERRERKRARKDFIQRVAAE